MSIYHKIRVADLRGELNIFDWWHLASEQLLVSERFNWFNRLLQLDLVSAYFIWLKIKVILALIEQIVHKLNY